MCLRQTIGLCVALVVTTSSEMHAQPEHRARMRAVMGCWRIDASPFKAGSTGKVDPGQTILPPLIALDSVAGKSWWGDTLGYRVRSFPGSSGTHYADGYYTFPTPTKLALTWSNGVVGMQLDLQSDSLLMRGRASAWTDYLTGEDATVTLRRTVCA